ncbi:MAG TPA: hypothetical protein VGI31_03475 [Streptosporangiaceae bacterium]|jgi:hypothetical protein
MDLVTKYLVRIWPTDGEPTEMIQSEMCSPDSAIHGQSGNDHAEIRAIRNWAQQHANVDRIRYSFEVCRDSMEAALAGAGSSHRVVEPIADGVLEPEELPRLDRPGAWPPAG